MNVINHVMLENILDYEDCKYREMLIDKLIEECSENIDKNKMTNVTLNKYKNICRSFTIYIIFLVVFLIISISIGSVFLHFYCYLKKSNTNFILGTEATIY